jgi:two-component system response regulator HydG
MAKRILVVDDDQAVLQSCRNILTDEGHEVETAADGVAGLALLKDSVFDLALIDLKMPRLGGLETLEAARRIDPLLVAIIFTAYATIETAVEAIKQGAFNYVTKPFRASDLVAVVGKGLEHRAALQRSTRAQAGAQAGTAGEEIIGQSEIVQSTLRMLRKLAVSDANALITGESGTGKELAARAIHAGSKRAARPLVAVDCASIPEHLLESELFGFVKGAFTGADRSRRGLLEQADGSTLLLDEIGEMSLSLQARLLRVLQERSFRRLGDEKLISVDLRIISSTNRDLEAAVTQGRFRSDLLFRLNVVRVHMPPLRERDLDIALLAHHFIRVHAAKLGREGVVLAPEAVELLEAYEWPGNVRELQNAIERAVVLNESGVIGPADLPEYVVRALSREATDYKSARAAWVEGQGKQYFKELLARHKGNISSAAREAQISRKCFYQLMKKFDIESRR